MNTNNPVNNYNPDDYKFETISEFKKYFTACPELGFEYNATEYFIDRIDYDRFELFDISKQTTVAENLTMEQLLDFEIDGVKMRDFIATDDVMITNRPGASF